MSAHSHRSEKAVGKVANFLRHVTLRQSKKIAEEEVKNLAEQVHEEVEKSEQDSFKTDEDSFHKQN